MRLVAGVLSRAPFVALLLLMPLVLGSCAAGAGQSPAPVADSKPVAQIPAPAAQSRVAAPPATTPLPHFPVEAHRCDGLAIAFQSIPFDSPAYKTIGALARQRCDEALDLAALAALYYGTDGERWKNNQNWLNDTVHHCAGWAGVACDTNRRVVRLRLASNNLAGPIPAAFGNLSALQELYLGYNQLTNLPSEFGNLSQLRFLDLRRNQLSHLPPEIGNLSCLEHLVLWGTS